MSSNRDQGGRGLVGWENNRVLLVSTTIIRVPKMVLLPLAERLVFSVPFLNSMLRHFDSLNFIAKGLELMSEPMSEANAYIHELESGPVSGMVYTTNEILVKVLSDR